MRPPVLPDLRAVRRLLIIRLSSIGDVVHAIPLSAALGEAFPHLEITWLVEEMSADIVTGNPYLKEVIVVPRGRWKQGRLRSPRVWREYLAFLADLRRRRFEVSLDIQGHSKSGLMALATGAPYRLGWWRLRDGAQFASRPLPRRPESVHRVDWFLDVARALGAEPTAVRFPLAIPEASRAQAAELLRSVGIAPSAPYAVLNPATGDHNRRWGARPYAELAVALAERHGLPSVLIGSGKDRTLCAEIIALARERQGVRVTSPNAPHSDAQAGALIPVSLAGQTDLKQLAAVLEGCTIQVCGDTGSAHIAAALGRPVVATFGPTDPAHAGPWGQLDRVLARRDLCFPDCPGRCRSIERRSGGTQAIGAQGEPTPRLSSAEAITPCLRAITPAEVLARVEQVLYES
jgi:heptosyltransferase-1